MTNRLTLESSPYLRQHADNPVDWHPWGPDALEQARRDDRPILLSIGYAACHWCHVMAHESFEDPETAALMNELFVNIKVDREERPDLDGIYMQAVQAMTGQGGWPMTVFLTPEGVPFYGGTYFPPEDRHGLPAFRRVLRAIADSYRDRRTTVDQTAARLRDLYATTSGAVAAPDAQPISAHTLDLAFRSIARQYDMRTGGFGGAPKFPHAMIIEFLLQHWARTGTAFALEIAVQSMRHMARGGIYDQVGGGFHRYAVDAGWLVPHFEKMLYDNALLTRAAVHLWQATGCADDEMRRVAEETVEWLAREMTSPEGGFYATIDADSEGHEGRFYLWTESDLDDVLGEDAPLMKRYWGVTAGGNFEGSTILSVPVEPAAVAQRAGIDVVALRAVVDRARAALLHARDRRVRPARDEKILAAWNGLMLRAVCEAARAFGRDDFRALAIGCGEFLARRMLVDHGRRVMRAHTAGVSRIPGFLEDHAAVALGFLDLHALTFDRRWLDAARSLGDAIVDRFGDDASGRFYDTARDHEALITRPRDVTDNATPSGLALTVELLLRLGDIFDDASLRDRARAELGALVPAIAQHGLAFGHLLTAADLAVHGATQLVIAGNPAAADFQSLAAEAARHYQPTLIVTGGDPDFGEGVALLAQRPTRNGAATAYVCHGYVCDTPVTAPSDLAGQLRSPSVDHA